MTGGHQHTLDAKGRLFIPAKLREELGNVFFVTISPEKCLSVYSSESWESLSSKVNAMPYSDQRKMRPLFAYATKCELDSQGRILLPQMLREFAGLTKNVTVVGNNNHAEIWDTDSWNDVFANEGTPENLMAVMEELLF
jgi:mraZ protein